MSQKIILDLADYVRNLLLTEFPEYPMLRYQCKRASILLDLGLTDLGISSEPRSGFIAPTGTPRTPDNVHVWSLVRINGKDFILDVTLTQFEDLLGEPIQPIIFGLREEIEKVYSYVPTDAVVIRTIGMMSVNLFVIHFILILSQ